MRVLVVEDEDRLAYPVVKRIVNASFGQVRLVVRYAPLHKGSDKAVQIL